MKFGSIMESHTRIPYPLLVLGYDDPKGSKNPRTQKWPQLIQRYKHKDGRMVASRITENVTQKIRRVNKKGNTPNGSKWRLNKTQKL